MTLHDHQQPYLQLVLANCDGSPKVLNKILPELALLRSSLRKFANTTNQPAFRGKPGSADFQYLDAEPVIGLKAAVEDTDNA